MQPATGPVRQSFLSWMLAALGFKYALLLPASALLVFLLALFLVVRGKGPMAAAALVLSVPIPFLIGVIAALEGGIGSFQVIAMASKEPAPGQVAGAVSTMLAPLVVGLTLTGPSYLVAVVGSVVRAFIGEPDPLRKPRD